MSRKLTLQSIVIDEVALGITKSGKETVSGNLDTILYKLYQTNSAGFTGTLTIQAKNDDTDWDDLPIQSIALAADDTIYVQCETIFKYVRPVITVTAGTADFVVGLYGKTIGA